MRGSIPRLVLVAPIAVALAVTLAASRPYAMAGADAPALKSISSRLDGAVSTVLIEASDPVAYLTSQPDPLTVLVDLRNVSAAAIAGQPIADMLTPVSGVAVESATAPDGTPVARVRVNLDRAAKHRVRAARNTILVEVQRDGTAPVATPVPALIKSPLAAAPSTEKSAAPAVEKRPSTSLGAGVSAVERRAAATQLRAVRYEKTDNGYVITLSGNGPLLAAKVDEAKDLPPRVLLDFHGVSTGTAPAITTVKDENVDKVRVATNSREPLITRVVIDLAKKLPYTVEQVGDDLRVMFRSAVDTAMAAVAPAPAEKPADAPVDVPAATPVPANETAPAAAPAPAPVVVAPNPVPPVVQAIISQAPLPVATPAVFSAQPQPATNSLQGTFAQGPRQFSGDPVTLDFQGADLRAVLRTFAEISNGLNIVIDPTIQGTVDVSLHDVPWDQALDIILRANKLGYSVEGNIVRIVPLNVLASENEERRKLQDAQALAGELRMLTVPVSYAKAADLVPVITRSALSARGDVQVDARTNTLIIRDLADRLSSASDLVRTLDRPQPQVEIEARIVQISRRSARELGIQWGFNGKVDPALGTSTGLAFPSNGALKADTGTFNPATGTGNSVVGLALGSINGALNLNANLSALETEGKIRILSTPRVATQNNVEAEITQGAQIPIQVVSNNTVTVQFRDAALTMRVTPQITASNTVIMRIFVEKASPNYSETSAAQPIPSIDTQRAVTSVLMDDGETTVIGGIYSRNESDSETRTPFLHRVPLLGWLFKTEVRNDDSDELLIFITPRIAK
jgi:type IV pilus assembly protein PilQ